MLADEEAPADRREHLVAVDRERRDVRRLDAARLVRDAERASAACSSPTGNLYSPPRRTLFESCPPRGIEIGETAKGLGKPVTLRSWMFSGVMSIDWCTDQNSRTYATSMRRSCSSSSGRTSTPKRSTGGSSKPHVRLVALLGGVVELDRRRQAHVDRRRRARRERRLAAQRRCGRSASGTYVTPALALGAKMGPTLSWL